MHVVQLHIYPVKSMRGCSLDATELDSRGMLYDRHWMMTDADGMFITQREQNSMARMKVEIVGDTLCFQADQEERYCLSLHNESRTQRAVQVWDDQFMADDEGDEVAQFLSDYFHRPCRLVRMPDEPARRISAQYSPQQAPLHFADAQPLHIVNMASLKVLNETLTDPVGIDRFRANIVVDDTDAFAEDHFHRLRIGELNFRFVKTTSRCVVTTIDQLSGEQSKQPLQSLSEIRRFDNRTLFGVYLAQEGIGGSIKVGDVVETL